MSQPMELLLDPFDDNIVKDPRRVDYSVPRFNDHVVDRVRLEIDLLTTDERPRFQARSKKALFISSPTAGFGKSHLIGKLFKEFNGRATLVNILPFEDPDTCWKSLLMRVVQELQLPDRFLETRSNNLTPSQLELFTHGILSQVVIDHMAATGDNMERTGFLRGPVEELAHLKRGRTWIAYLRRQFKNGQWLSQVERRLKSSGLHLKTPASSWLKILFGYTYIDDDFGLAQACSDWIQADPVDEDVIRPLGISPADLPRADVSAGEINELAKQRFLDLCRLAGFYRPFLFCFDQTESYGKSDGHATSLSVVISDMINEAYNHVTLMTVNIDPWEKRIRPHWQQAHLDRLRPLQLNSISREQGVELADHRLVAAEKKAVTKQRFWGDNQWLDDIFKDRQAIGVRMFLGACSRRWEEMASLPQQPEPKQPLENIFARYIDKVNAKGRHLVFDRDIFLWLVTDLANGLEGLIIDKVSTKFSDNAPCWQYKNKTFVFGFETGNNASRWGSFARDALDTDPKNNRILVFPRTPELPQIPKPTWKATKGEILKAMKSCLLVLQLNKHQLLRLYAAHELYADALQGDIQWKLPAITDFLRQQLAEFWQSILEWKGGETGKMNGENGDDPQLRQAIVKVLRKEKFLSLEDLMQKLPGEAKRETILALCGEELAIKIHKAPNTTVLQWQSEK